MNTPSAIVKPLAASAMARALACQGLSFAIPIEVDQRVMQQILATGTVRHARLGIAVQEVDQTLAEAFELERPAGALIADVGKGSASELAGLQSVDAVLAVGSQRVEIWGTAPALNGNPMVTRVSDLEDAAIAASDGGVGSTPSPLYSHTESRTCTSHFTQTSTPMAARA